jgi:hypothetical protein
MTDKHDFYSLDDLIEENNRLIMKSGGPKPISKLELERARKVIAEDKRQHLLSEKARKVNSRA